MRLELGRLFFWTVALVALSGPMVGVSQAAPLPGDKFISTALVSPSAAWSFFDQKLGASSAHTVSVSGMEPPLEIKELAASIRAASSSDSEFANRANTYVLENIRTEMRFELGKGGFGALIDQSGTSLD